MRPVLTDRDIVPLQDVDNTHRNCQWLV